MNKETSIGAVVFRKDSGRLQFLILKRKDNSIWEFPKGHIEKGENELNPQFGEAYRNRGNDHYYLGNFELMMSDFDNAIKFMPSSALAFNNRGFALQHLSRYQEAVNAHNRAIELDQTYAEAYSDRAKALKELGKNDLAKSDEEEAKRLTSLQNRFDSEWKKITWPSLKEDGLKFLVLSD